MQWRHGTPTGWSQHKRVGERPCDACYKAKQEYDQRHRSAPEAKRKARLASRAQQRALMKLKDLHPGQYRLLYQQAKQDLLAEENEA